MSIADIFNNSITLAESDHLLQKTSQKKQTPDVIGSIASRLSHFVNDFQILKATFKFCIRSSCLICSLLSAGGLRKRHMFFQPVLYLQLVLIGQKFSHNISFPRRLFCFHIKLGRTFLPLLFLYRHFHCYILFRLYLSFPPGRESRIAIESIPNDKTALFELIFLYS